MLATVTAKNRSRGQRKHFIENNTIKCHASKVSVRGERNTIRKFLRNSRIEAEKVLSVYCAQCSSSV